MHQIILNTIQDLRLKFTTSIHLRLNGSFLSKLLNQSIKKINLYADNFQVKLRQLWCGNSSPITNLCGLVAVSTNHCVNLWLTWGHMGLKSVTTVPTLSLCVRSGSSDVYVHVTDGMPHSCEQMLCTVRLLLLMPKN